MVKIADTIFENLLIDKLTDGKISAEFIEKTAQFLFEALFFYFIFYVLKG